MGAHGLVHPEDELATARATGKLHVPMVLSTPSTRSLESVAQANGPNSVRWFQLYWPRGDEITLSLLARAKVNEFSALVVTLDTNVNGWRTHDLSRAYARDSRGRRAESYV
ncbi:FMN-dependent dehydrogenase [Sparassis latifolia]